MTKIITESFKARLKRSLYEGFGLTVLRGQIVLQMEKLSRLTSRDYIRICSFELVVEEIRAQAVAGSIAELGVYKGDFAKHLSAAFPDRMLYLFDTFAGFSEQDKDVEIREGFSTASENFADTSVEMVVSKMEHPDNVRVRAGYFPESIQDADRGESFAFVSIDTDLHKPIYDGLQFFYPRLSKGGYIFIHDYNNEGYSGVKAAVRKYCSEEGIHYVPLVDPCGTAIITKG